MTRIQIIKHSLLPGVMPRLKDLFISGFQQIPFFMALVYQAVRLLPAGHPYTNAANIGKFGIRHVVGEAANNLVFSRKNADQIFVFFIMLAGLVIIFMQVGLLGVSLFAGSAMAAMPTNFAGFFLTPTATTQQDLAYMMFDLIFGLPNNGTPMFGSCFSMSTACLDAAGDEIVNAANQSILSGLGWPLPIHRGLHAMFLTYNTGLMVVGALLLAYLIVTILMETAQTGTAFGKRFNKVWTPLRIVFAFGLLLPFGLGAGGLNSAQYIVLYAAKFGSGFATNGWNLFNVTLGQNSLAGNNATAENLVSMPELPDLNGFLQFIYTAGVCYELELYGKDRFIFPYAVRDTASPTPNLQITPSTTYQELIDFVGNDRQIVIRFGGEDREKNTKERGFVDAACGEMVIPRTDPRNPSNATNPPEPAATIMEAFYFSIMKELWWYTFDGYLNGAPGRGIPNELTPYINRPYAKYTVIKETTDIMTAQEIANVQGVVSEPPAEYKTAIMAFYRGDLEAAVRDPASRQLNTLDGAIGTQGVVRAMVGSTRWGVPEAVLQKGWAGAGIWYNRIAELNGIVTAAVYSAPITTLYPKVMEEVRKKSMQTNQNIASSERFKPILAQGQDLKGIELRDAEFAKALWAAFNFWETDQQAATTHVSATGNPILDTINQIFGTSGLYSMRKNPDIHPLAQLVGIGRSLIEATTRLIGAGATGTVIGAMLGKDGGGPLAAVGVSFVMTIAMTTLTIGFMLFYLLPFMPFIYFFFAVGAWFKAIFEAMVGAPLWALAHIKMDGQGLAGQAAVQGYFLILEIFLRPILIIFGLLGSISIFAALVSVLNMTWDIVIANVGGFNVEEEISTGTGPTSVANIMRGPIDEFFFTVIYAIIVYIMALNCFKMVDHIPSSILRWMGQSVTPFNDSREDPGQSLSSTAGIGAQQAISSIGGSMSKAMTSIAAGKGPTT